MDVHKRTNGASTIASFLVANSKFLRFRRAKKKRSKRLSYVCEPPDIRHQSSSEEPGVDGFICKFSDLFRYGNEIPI